MSEPKTVQRRINFRKANRQMPRRRHDIPADLVVHTNPELLTKFTSETGKILPRRARNVVRADVERQWQRGSVGVRTQYQGGRFDNLANTRALDSYLTVDLRAEWRISAALRLQARLDNLSDETYESASFYPQPGREWHVGIRYAAR